jgi:hypothetical protein
LPPESDSDSDAATQFAPLREFPKEGEVDLHWKYVHAVVKCKSCKSHYLKNNEVIHQLLICTGALSICSLCKMPITVDNLKLHDTGKCVWGEESDETPRRRSPKIGKCDICGMPAVGDHKHPDMAKCSWCEKPIYVNDRRRHEDVECTGLRCPICQGFCESRKNYTFNDCNHMMHSDCLGFWPKISPNICPLCIPLDNGFAAFARRIRLGLKKGNEEGKVRVDPDEEVDDDEEADEDYEVKNCPLKFPMTCPFQCSKSQSKFEWVGDLYHHLLAEHEALICKICGMDYLTSSLPQHRVFCDKRDAICPASGCNQRVPVAFLEESRTDAGCLVKHHRCKGVFQCLICNGYQRSHNKLKRHAKSHTPDEIDRNTPLSLRPRREAFKRANGHIKTVVNISRGTI